MVLFLDVLILVLFVLPQKQVVASGDGWKDQQQQRQNENMQNDEIANTIL